MGLALAALIPIGVFAAPKKLIHDDGSRTRAVHEIPLLDKDGGEIFPQLNDARPFSTKTTCGDCHNYETINMGWHFNSTTGNTKPGRPGEPWVLVDESAGVQLPLSYRGWPNMWQPEQAGLTPWQFLKTFGRHMPGGDVGPEDEAPPDPNARWHISGELEINCLACHNNSPEQNMSDWAKQIARENFEWAVAGSSGMGTVRNVASRLPNSYDYWNGPNPDNSWAQPPKTEYDLHHFNHNNFVNFDVMRNPSPNRCYFCHTTIPAKMDLAKQWEMDGDFHVTAAKFTCTDCHRNGIDHFIVRGYEGEYTQGSSASLSCRGCHLGVGDSPCAEASGGRVAAPRPLHRTLPAFHIEKMTCTACHSGPMPQKEVGRVKTARANRLGIHGRAQWDTELPHIQSPVLMRQADGKIAPHNMIWPAFWGKMKGNEVTPIPLETVTPLVTDLRQKIADAKAEQQRLIEEAEAAKATALSPTGGRAEEGAAEQKPADETSTDAAPTDAAPTDAASANGAAAEEEPADGAETPASPNETKAGDTPTEEAPAPETAPVVQEAEVIEPLTEEQVATILAQLAAGGAVDGEPVYVCSGKVHKLSSGNTLTAFDNAAAQPCAWPFGHDVRPASQSLGAGGCTDCHAPDSAVFLAEVKPDGPVQMKTVAASVPMYKLQGLDAGVLSVVEKGMRLRYFYVVGALAFAAALAVALVHYGFAGLEGFFRLLVATGSRKN